LNRYDILLRSEKEVPDFMLLTKMAVEIIDAASLLPL
jgi:hypothetical protein